MKSLISMLALMGAVSGHVLGARDIVDDDPATSLAGCPEPDAEFLKLAAEVAEKEKEEEENPTPLAKRAVLNIHTWVHVAAASKNLKDGWVEEKHILDQIKLLNKIYKPYDVQFNHKGTDRVVDADLAVITDGEPIEKLGKKMRKGDYAALNIYIVKDLPRNVAGDCSLPTGNPGTTFKYDGCRINYDTLPGIGSGKIIVHEVGHWLGLQHTFQQGTNPSCTSGTGDGIDDTPVHLRPNGVDCKEVDTCPGKAGKDPIHNFMNYTPTSCQNTFTAGQKKRMHSMFKVRMDNKHG